MADLKSKQFLRVVCRAALVTVVVSLLLVSGPKSAGAQNLIAETATGAAQIERSGENPDELVHWYIEGAQQGYASSQHQLGLLYFAGEAVPQNYAEAFRWFQLAALQDYPPAQFSLARLYQQGNGVERDPVIAYAWYHVAAMNRMADAVAARDHMQLLLDTEQISYAHWQVKKLWKKIAEAQTSASP